MDVAEECGGGGGEVEPCCWYARGRGWTALGLGLRDAASERGLLRHARHAADEWGRARHAALDRGMLVAAAQAAAFPGFALRAGQAGAGNSSSAVPISVMFRLRILFEHYRVSN